MSYIKAIDVWMTTCMCFLFAALIEFAFCNSLARLIVKESHEPFGFCTKERELTVSNQVSEADLGGAPPNDQIYLDFMQFLGKFNKILSRRPQGLAPPVKILDPPLGL